MILFCFMFLCVCKIINGCKVYDSTLNCSGLNLTETFVPQEVRSSHNVGHLTNLNFSFNALSSPLNFSDWLTERIEVLDLSNNNISYVNTDTFAQIKNLKVLNISNNHLSTVKFKWSLLPPLENVDLSNNNKLGGYLHIFDDLLKSKLTHLNLSSTGVTLPAFNVFSRMISLLSLDLSSNNLTYIPDLPANLEYLDFSNNSIAHIDPDCFDKDTRLRIMLLEHNKNLHEIRYESFNFLVELRWLSFRGCVHLSHLPTSLFYYNKKLEYLSLAGCNFRNISVAFKNSFLSVEKIDLENNPWHCSSHIKWLVQLHDHKIVSDNIRCASPENITLAEFLGPKVKHKVVRILLTLISVILFCILITAVGFSCSMENKRRKTFNSYTTLERSSKPYRGSMVYVTSPV